MTTMPSRISDLSRACFLTLDALNESGGYRYLVIEGDNHRPARRFATVTRPDVTPLCTFWTEADTAANSK